jgi:GT2 family glycosyltransferase
MPPPGTTVAIVLFNGRDHLAHCLPAAGRLAGDVAEVLVVDNGSTDGGGEWVRANHPEVRLVELGRNLGPAAARNRALAESRTDRVLLLDCDVVVAPDCLERLTAALDETPAAIVQPRALFADDPSRIHYDGAAVNYLGLLTLRNFGAAVRESDDEPVSVDAVISMALLLDRSRLEAAGDPSDAFDELYFIYFEDTDLSYRLRLAGGTLRVVPQATVLHREGTVGVSYRAGKRISYRRAFLLSRNRWIFLLKNFSARTLWLTLPAQLLYEAVLFGFLTLRGQPHGWFLGKMDLLRQGGAILRRRRDIRTLRTVGDGALLGFTGFSFIPALHGGRLARLFTCGLDAVFGVYWKLVRWAIRA